MGVSSTVYSGTFQKSKTVAIKVMKLQRKQKDLKDFKQELYIMSQARTPWLRTYAHEVRSSRRTL